MMIFNNTSKPAKRYGAEADNAEKELVSMVENPAFSTGSGSRKEDGAAFVERHMTYLRNHTHVNPEGYLANLRTMTRVPKNSEDK